MNITGSSGRRKTALANALAHALDYPHVLYHDFTSPAPPPAPIVVTEEGETPQAVDTPLSPFERIVTEACAYSEGARTILILDQLQAAQFNDHIRLYHFVQTREWNAALGTVIANPGHFLLVLIAEEPLYHSLAKVSFRVHADASRAFLDFRPDDFGLPDTAEAFMDALAAVFTAIGASPTQSEYVRILEDVHLRVRTEEQLRQSLFGWMENVDRNLLYAPHVQDPLSTAVHAINAYLGIEVIELGS